MPFTFSHPALVLPAKCLPERWVCMTGLIIGSITPDFEYFLRMRNLSLYSHTWVGMFWFDLPVGLLLTFVYHGIVRDSLIDSLPGFLRKRLHKFTGFNWKEYVRKHWAVVLISMLVGIASHILWDGFTHRYGFFVKMFPSLKENVYLFSDVGYTKYYVLQNISTFVGGIIVLYSILRIPAEPIPPKAYNWQYPLIATGIALAVIGLRLLSGLDYRKFLDLGVTIISAMLIALIVTSLIVKPKKPSVISRQL